jgi:hypothetical protein
VTDHELALKAFNQYWLTQKGEGVKTVSLKKEWMKGYLAGRESMRAEVQDYLDDMLRIKDCERALEAERMEHHKLKIIFKHFSDQVSVFCGKDASGVQNFIGLNYTAQLLASEELKRER